MAPCQAVLARGARWGETAVVPPRVTDAETEILEAASRILSAEGASALTVRRIASEAGCSTMGIYSRFGGKYGVVDALYAEGFRVLVDGMTALPSSDDAVADLRLGCLCYRDLALSHSMHYMVMFGGAVPGFEPSPDNKRYAHDAFDCLIGEVQRCVDAGAFKGDARDLAHTLWSAMHGQVMLELVGLNPVGGDTDTQYQELLDTVIDGLRAR
jgi:AcrR family transcriptional regulator